MFSAFPAFPALVTASLSSWVVSSWHDLLRFFGWELLLSWKLYRWSLLLIWCACTYIYLEPYMYIEYVYVCIEYIYINICICIQNVCIYIYMYRQYIPLKTYTYMYIYTCIYIWFTYTYDTYHIHIHIQNIFCLWLLIIYHVYMYIWIYMCAVLLSTSRCDKISWTTPASCWRDWTNGRGAERKGGWWHLTNWNITVTKTTHNFGMCDFHYIWHYHRSF